MADGYELGGRIELAYMERVISPYCVRRRLSDGGEILVSHGLVHVGKECLVRVNSKPNRKGNNPLGDFITSQIPKDFSGLASNDYVFCALWEKRMNKCRVAPHFNELEVYYNPGKWGYFYFIQPNSTQRKGRIRVASNGMFNTERNTLSKIVQRYLPDPQRYARLIVAEGQECMERVLEVIEDKNLVPVVLESLV